MMLGHMYPLCTSASLSELCSLHRILLSLLKLLFFAKEMNTENCVNVLGVEEQYGTDIKQ